MMITGESVTTASAAQSSRVESVAADRFAAGQMEVMQGIISGRNSTQQAFVDSHPDTTGAFRNVIDSLFASGSSHANEAARIAATVQEMRNAEKAYRESM
jgi:formate dehydrogenase maturation protein FdhE